MFRSALFWIVLLLLGALAAQFLLADPGRVVVSWRGTDYATSVAYAVAGLLALLAALWLLWAVFALPLRSWRASRDRRARARIGEGFDAFNRGEYTRAEKLLEQAADSEPDIAASARVAAARAAAARGDLGTARRHLDALGDVHAADRALASAELALADDRPTDALVALDAPAAQPLPPRGLALRAQALAASGHAHDAYGMLGSLRKQEAFPGGRLDELQENWAAASLREAEDRNALADRWQALPKPLQGEPAVVRAYAGRASALGWHEAAAGSLEQALDARWDEELMSEYLALPAPDPAARHATYQRWLKTRAGSPALARALAQSERARGDWPAAEAHLLRGLQHGGSSRSWEALGEGYAEAGEEARARISYANALRVARGEQPLPLATPVVQAEAVALEPAPPSAIEPRPLPPSS